MKFYLHAILAAALVFAQTVQAAAPAIPPSAPIPKATKTQIIAPLQINACGDSLTTGGQDSLGGSYPGELFADTNTPTNNFGVSGQLSTQIAMRCGAVQITLTVSGNSLTAGGASNTLTAINGVALAGTSTTQSPDYRFLSTSGDNGVRLLYGTLCGTHGYVKRSASGGPPSTAETYVYFIDFVSGLNSQTQTVPCPANSVFTPDSARNLGQAMIYEGGRNNYTATAVVESDWGSVASAQPSSNYLMLTILNGDYSTEQSGQSGYNTIITDNTFLTSTYPSNSWDWRSWLISQYSSGNVVDVLNHTNDVVPYTLRAQVGAGTLNGAITSTGCPTLTQTTGSVAASQTLKVDSEYIYVTGVSGSTVTSCTRGYGTGGTAASHSNGAAYTLVDPLHLSSATYKLVGDYINSNYLTLLTPQASQASYMAPSNWASIIGQNPPPIGSPTAPFYVPGQLFTGGNIRVPYGQFFQTYDGSSSGGSEPNQSGNIVNVARYVNNILYFGGGFVSSVCMGTGGTGGLCPFSIANNGNATFNSGLTNGVVIAGSNSNPSISVSGGTLTLPSSLIFGSTSQTMPAGAIVGTSDTQTLTNKSIAASEVNSGTLGAAQMPALTGDVTTSAGAVTTTLATVNSNTGAISCPSSITLNAKGLATAATAGSCNLSGTSSSIGGSALLAGACTSGTVTVTGATTSMVATASPVTYPGDGFDWAAYVSSANTVTVKVCGFIAGTPTASNYNVRVLQ